MKAPDDRVPATGYMIAAGGSGGHMFPAMALAQELARRGRRVDLMTDARGERFDAQFPAANIYRLRSASLSLSKPHRLVTGLAQLVSGAATARRILNEANSAVVIGFGGYPSLPPLVAATLGGIPTCIHEQNAVVGRANRLMGRFADAVALSFEQTARMPERMRVKAEITGNPVRDAVTALAGTPYPDSRPKRRFILVVFGGSQGARLFSDVVPNAIVNLPRATRAGLEVIQQTRAEDVERVRAIYARSDIKFEVAPFFRDLPNLMARASLVVCRSGASTIAELGAIGRPAILVPLPHSLDKDQLLNAQAFTRTGAGWLVEESEFNADRLSGLLTRLRFAPDELEQSAERAGLFGTRDAVQRLADMVEQLARARAATSRGVVRRALAAGLGLMAHGSKTVGRMFRSRGGK